jgi:hypothetical protein
MWRQGQHVTPLEEDLSIVFPEFFDRDAVKVGEQGLVHEVDGVMLRAISTAADDFLPPSSREHSCWHRQESYRYRAIRQGDIVFVRIYSNPEACVPGPRMLDGGAKYAINLEGRILRRVFDGEPEGPLVPVDADAGPPGAASDPSIPVGDTAWGEPVEPLPPSLLDGGT